MDNITKILLRQDSKANWETNNTILSAGEIGVAFDNGSVWGFKIGDGRSAWNNIPYYLGDTAALLEKVATLEDNYNTLDAQVNGTDQSDGLVDDLDNLDAQINGENGIAATLESTAGTVSSQGDSISTLQGQMSTLEGTTLPAIDKKISDEVTARADADIVISHAIKEVNDILDEKVPNPPSEDDELIDGTYILKCTVLNHVATYSWELDDGNSPI